MSGKSKFIWNFSRMQLFFMVLDRKDNANEWKIQIYLEFFLDAAFLHGFKP